MILIVTANAYITSSFATGIVAYIFVHSLLGSINTLNVNSPNTSSSTGVVNQVINLLNGESFSIQFYPNTGVTLTLAPNTTIAIQRIS